MPTATEAIGAREAAHRKMVFEYQIESFLNQWKPQDRYEASQFESQLISLIRQVYTDAQEPIMAHFTKVVMALPVMPILRDIGK
jgi:hypothetical protein